MNYWKDDGSCTLTLLPVRDTKNFRCLVFIAQNHKCWFNHTHKIINNCNTDSTVWRTFITWLELLNKTFKHNSIFTPGIYYYIFRPAEPSSRITNHKTLRKVNFNLYHLYYHQCTTQSKSKVNLSIISCTLMCDKCKVYHFWTYHSFSSKHIV
jgi:hypothetical protein